MELEDVYIGAKTCEIRRFFFVMYIFHELCEGASFAWIFKMYFKHKFLLVSFFHHLFEETIYGTFAADHTLMNFRTCICTVNSP